jgi:hypothetical protein
VTSTRGVSSVRRPFRHYLSVLLVTTLTVSSGRYLYGGTAHSAILKFQSAAESTCQRNYQSGLQWISLCPARRIIKGPYIGYHYGKYLHNLQGLTEAILIVNRVELHLSGLVGTANCLGVLKLRIIKISLNRLNWRFEVELDSYKQLFNAKYLLTFN